MFEVAGLSVAVANASEDIKNKVEHIKVVPATDYRPRIEGKKIPYVIGDILGKKL